MKEWAAGQARKSIDVHGHRLPTLYGRVNLEDSPFDLFERFEGFAET